MKKLPQNFSLDKHGFKVRLINQDDADFILSLRANPHRTKYMITLDYNIKSQRKWIQEYKKREKEGLDYYFIYSIDEGKPIGVNRISQVNLNIKTCKSSSWIAIKDLKYDALKMLLIGNEIVFHTMGINMTWGEAHKKNTRVIKIFKLFGYTFNDNGTEYYDFKLVKSDFIKACKNKILSRLKSNNRLEVNL